MVAVVGATAPATAQSNVDLKADPAPVQQMLNEVMSLSARGAWTEQEIARYFVGELADIKPSALNMIPKLNRIVMLTNDNAVARVPAIEAIQDTYLYLAKGKSGQWRVTALRSLALPQFIDALEKDLRSTPNLGATMRNMLLNIELTKMNDQQLATWFGEHRKELDQMRQMKALFQRHDNEDRFRTDKPEFDAIVDKLHLNYAAQEGKMFNVSIGGILDNSVGLLHAEPADVPAINSGEYIWIEPLSEGWYLYRTT